MGLRPTEIDPRFAPSVATPSGPRPTGNAPVCAFAVAATKLSSKTVSSPLVINRFTLICLLLSHLSAMRPHRPRANQQGRSLSRSWRAEAKRGIPPKAYVARYPISASQCGSIYSVTHWVAINKAELLPQQLNVLRMSRQELPAWSNLVCLRVLSEDLRCVLLTP
jgi:hypothetical protein